VDLNDEIKKGVYEHNKKEKLIQLNKIRLDQEHERVSIFNENDIRDWERVFKMKAKLLPVHLKNECPNRIIYCGLCGNQEEAKKMNLHKNDLCIKRNVCCTNKGCSKVVSSCDLDKHINNDCKFLFRYCTEGCREMVISMKMSTHLLKDCSMRYVLCTLNCGSTMRYNVLNMHMLNDCIRRGSGKTKEVKKALYEFY
jgi:hypothetical protein